MRLFQYRKSADIVLTKGLDLSDEEVLVVPDQSMSLEEILHRFVRGDELNIGGDIGYGDNQDEDLDNPLSVDVEKIRHMDLVELDELRERVQDARKRFETDEKDRKAKAEAEAEKRSKEREEAEERKFEERMAKRQSKQTSDKLA